jgi:anti-sigma factor ChrR (cupin superfamily)
VSAVKKEIENLDTDLIPWEKMEGLEKVYVKILNEDKETGAVTRLLKIEPGGTFPKTKHEICEEILVLDGVLIDKGRNIVHTKGSYISRNPYMEHGPFESPFGCVLLEFRYYGFKGKEGK